MQRPCCFCISDPIAFVQNGCKRVKSNNINGDSTQAGYGERLAAMGLGRKKGGSDDDVSVPGGEGKNVEGKSTTRRKSFTSSATTEIEEDDDVMAERDALISGSFPDDAPIQVYGLRK